MVKATWILFKADDLDVGNNNTGDHAPSWVPVSCSGGGPGGAWALPPAPVTGLGPDKALPRPDHSQAWPIRGQCGEI